MKQQESYTTNDRQYLMDAIIEVNEDDPPEIGYAALLELHTRLLQTQPYWHTVGDAHQLRYLEYLYDVMLALQEKNWSLACNKLGDVLQWSRAKYCPTAYADAAVMVNIKAVLEEAFYEKTVYDTKD